MKIRIWGARGSMPTSVQSWEIEEKIVQAIYEMPGLNTRDIAAVRKYVNSLPPMARGTVGGNTTCVELQAKGNTTIIIDAGTGIRELGLKLMQGPCGKGKGTLHFVFSHLHMDHLQGFPLFIPAFIPGNQFFFHSIHDVESALQAQQQFWYWPVTLRREEPDIPHMNAKMTFIQHHADEVFYIDKVKVTSSVNDHPGVSYAYRFEDAHSSFVFASDAEYKDLEGKAAQKRIEFFKNADVVLFDAQYGLRDTWEKKVDFGHSSAMIGVHLARKARAKRLLLTHHDPGYSDQQLLAVLQTAIDYQDQDPDKSVCGVNLAYEGLELNLAPSGTMEIVTSSDRGANILTPGITFDQNEVEILREHLVKVSQGSAPAGSVVDLSEVDQLTPAGLKALLELSWSRKDDPIVLAELTPAVRETIRLAGYGDYFAIYPTIEAAVQAVNARRALELPGEIIGSRYQILEKLDQGWLGTILKAFDQQTGKTVAVKLLSPALSKETLSQLRKQFERAKELQHHAIIPLLDWGQEGERYFLVEAWVSAKTLEDQISSGEPLSNDEAESIIMHLLQALQHAHSQGIIHGHIKAGDVFLTDTGAMLGGFGLGHLEEGRNLLESPVGFLQLAYLSPEQILGQVLDARTDLYSLGVLMYQVFTGRHPFQGEGQEVLLSHLNQTPVPPHQIQPDISLPVSHMILKLMAKNPNERYASARHARQVAESLLFGLDESEHVGHTRLVGRESTLSLLEQSWARVAESSGEIVFITGEPGVGKTSLAMTSAIQFGAPVVLIGRCYEGNDYPAYHPFAEALQGYFMNVPPELSDEALHPLLGNLVQLIPDLSKQLPDLPELAELTPEASQLRLFSSVARFIRAASASRPWVLILDDLQWIDEGSLELLKYLGRQLPEMRVLVIGTFRDIDVEKGHPLRATMRELNIAPGYYQIALDRLDKLGVRQLLSQCWDDQVPSYLVQQIYERTGGNPLFIGEISRALEEERLVFPRGETWLYPDNITLQLPASVSEAVEGRIHFLDAETRDILTMASVLGETFRFNDLVVVSGFSEWKVLDHLDLILARQLVQEISGSDVLRFRHREIHDVIYEDLGTLRRRRLHLRIGEALENQAQPDPDQQAAILAHHFFQAGALLKALNYSITAGKQAQAVYANDRALGWYEKALSLVEKTNISDQFRIVLQQEEIHDLLGDRLAQKADLEKLDELAVQLDPVSSATALYRRARYALAISDYANAAADAQEVIDMVLSLNQETLEIECALIIGEVAMRTGEYKKAHEVLNNVLNLAKKAQDLNAEVRSHNMIGNLYLTQGSSVKAQKHYENGLSILQDLNEPLLEFNVLNGMGNNSASQGLYDEALRYFEQAEKLSREVGDRQSEVRVLNNLGFSYFRLGQYTTARWICDQGLEVARDIDERIAGALLLNNSGHINRTLGDCEKAYENYEKALEAFQEIGHREFEGFALIGLGEVLEYLGESDSALAAFEKGFNLRQELGNPVWLIETQARMTWFHLQQGNMEQAQYYANLVYEYLEAGETLFGSLEPLRIPLDCYQGLQEIDTQKAHQILSVAHMMLMDQAGKITDEKLRRSFLENVPWHREIVQLWSSSEAYKSEK